MKKIFFIFVLMYISSCNDFIDKPKNLIDKETMAEILADMAINDQAIFMFQEKNMESGTRFVLKSHNVKPDDFVESYKYYVIKEKMNGIVEEAQKILLKKDPKADHYVKDKLKKAENLPSLVR